jgi:hypothetical protein
MSYFAAKSSQLSNSPIAFISSIRLGLTGLQLSPRPSTGFSFVSPTPYRNSLVSPTPICNLAPTSKPRNCRVEMAVRAVEVNYVPLDRRTGGVDPSPTALGLDDGAEAVTCSHHRYVCAECSAPLCRDGS